MAAQAALAEVAAWLDGLAPPRAVRAAPWDAPAAFAPVSKGIAREGIAGERQHVLAELAVEFDTVLAVEAPAMRAVGGVTSADAAVAAGVWADTERADTAGADTARADPAWAPWATPAAPGSDAAPTNAASTNATLAPALTSPAFTPRALQDGGDGPPATALPWLALEAPLRPWERGDAGAPGGTDETSPASALGASCAVPVRAAPLAPPLAPALRNAKIDEVVALATAAPEPRPGRLRSLLQRFRAA